eukprot:PhF_6_TR40751/c0_g2_i4/m.61372
MKNVLRYIFNPLEAIRADRQRGNHTELQDENSNTTDMVDLQRVDTSHMTSWTFVLHGHEIIPDVAAIILEFLGSSLLDVISFSQVCSAWSQLSVDAPQWKSNEVGLSVRALGGDAEDQSTGTCARDVFYNNLRSSYRVRRRVIYRALLYVVIALLAFFICFLVGTSNKDFGRHYALEEMFVTILMGPTLSILSFHAILWVSFFSSMVYPPMKKVIEILELLKADHGIARSDTWTTRRLRNEVTHVAIGIVFFFCVATPTVMMKAHIGYVEDILQNELFVDTNSFHGKPLNRTVPLNGKETIVLPYGGQYCYLMTNDHFVLNRFPHVIQNFDRMDMYTVSIKDKWNNIQNVLNGTSSCTFLDNPRDSAYFHGERTMYVVGLSMLFALYLVGIIVVFAFMVPAATLRLRSDPSDHRYYVELFWFLQPMRRVFLFVMIIVFLILAILMSTAMNNQTTYTNDEINTISILGNVAFSICY